MNGSVAGLAEQHAHQARRLLALARGPRRGACARPGRRGWGSGAVPPVVAEDEEGEARVPAGHLVQRADGGRGAADGPPFDRHLVDDGDAGAVGGRRETG